MHVCVCAREKEIEKSERAHRWRPQVSMVVFSLMTLHLFSIERSYLTEPRACQLGYANWPTPPLALTLQMQTTAPDFYLDIGD